MTLDTRRLREMAEARRDGCGHCDPPSILCNDCMRNVDAFDGEIDHKTVIALLDEVERLRDATQCMVCGTSEQQNNHCWDCVKARIKGHVTAIQSKDEQLAAARAEIDVLRQECRERERAAEVSARMLIDQRDEARAGIERIRDELMASKLDVSLDDPPEKLAHYVFVLRMSLDECHEQFEQLQPILSVLSNWDWAQIANDAVPDAAVDAVVRALAHIAKERSRG